MTRRDRDSAPRGLVRLAVATFLQREANRRRCHVEDLAPMVEDAFDLALEGLRIGDELAHMRKTPVAPTHVEGVFSERQTNRDTPVVDLWEGRDAIEVNTDELWARQPRPPERK